MGAARVAVAPAAPAAQEPAAAAPAATAQAAAAPTAPPAASEASASRPALAAAQSADGDSSDDEAVGQADTPHPCGERATRLIGQPLQHHGRVHLIEEVLQADGERRAPKAVTGAVYSTYTRVADLL